MKKILYTLCLSVGLLSTMTACDDYLDVIPDNRMQIDNVEKIGLLLTGAYPYSTYTMMLAPRIDNVSDKGTGSTADVNTDSFYWRVVRNISSQDTPEYFWTAMWYTIASTNGALEAISKLEGHVTADQNLLKAYKGEALVLRAYAHFLLACIYCPLYDLSNPANNDTNMGLPYVVEQETEVNRKYERGTVKQLWDRIKEDLEAGLPLLGNDDVYAVPKYHFNKQAAYAFAARFYLYTGDYNKVIESVNAVIPKPEAIHDANVPELDPAVSFVRTNFQKWATDLQTYASSTDIKIAFNSASNPSNLLLCDVVSYTGYRTNTYRYATTDPDMRRTVQAVNPTGKEYAYKIFHSGDWNYYVPKFRENFKKSSISATTGVYHTQYIFFRLEEMLINRAEAYALTDRYDDAIADLNLFCRTRLKDYNATANLLTGQKISNFYEATVNDADFYMNKYNAIGSNAWSTDKKALVHYTLLCRQNEFIHEGLRYWDLVRYKIPVTHSVHSAYGGKTNTLYPGDDRWVIEIPSTVSLAGMKPNPREHLLSEEW